MLSLMRDHLSNLFLLRLFNIYKLEQKNAVFVLSARPLSFMRHFCEFSSMEFKSRNFEQFSLLDWSHLHRKQPWAKKKLFTPQSFACNTNCRKQVCNKQLNWTATVKYPTTEMFVIVHWMVRALHFANNKKNASQGKKREHNDYISNR